MERIETMRQITTIAFLFFFCVLNIRSASAQINSSIGTSGGLCWDNNAGTVTCRDIVTNTPLGSYTYGLGNGGLENYGSYLALGSNDTIDTVQLRNMTDNTTCVVEGHGYGLGGTATHIYVTNYYQNKLVKVANDLSAGSCSSATDVPLLGHSPRKIIVIGSKLYVLMDGTAVMAPSIDEVDTANGDTVVSHPLGAVDSDDIQNMTYEPSIDSFIVTYDSGMWAVSRSTWTKTSWGDVTSAMAGLDYLDGYVAAATYAGSFGYIFDATNPNAEIPVNLTFALGGFLGYSSIGLTAYFMTGTGLRAFNLSGVEQAFSPITTDVGGMVRVDPWVTGPVCNNGTKEAGEQCDGSDLGTDTCITQGFVGGTLACTSSCTFDTSGCISQICLNGTREGTEECDGSDFGGQTCQSRGYFAGTLSCSSGCTIDESGCNFCGNGVVNIGEGEQCDGSNLNGATCESLNFGPGTLSCNGSCLFDTSLCTAAQNCNNGIIEGNEECDGGNLNGHTCQEYGFSGGTPTCNPLSCMIETSTCTMCGNGNIDTGEQCDGNEFNGVTCESLGYAGGGTLACTATCNYDTSSCINNLCGNGVTDINEECDDGNQTDSDGCSSTCQVESGYECSGEPSTCTPLCGNNVLDDGEECDGQDFGSATCSDFGYDSGALSCTSSCTIDTSSCLACNQDGVVKELTPGDFDASIQLQGELMERYTQAINSKQSQPLEASCAEVEMYGVIVPAILVSVDDQHYVHFRVETSTFVYDRLFFSYSGSVELAVSVDNPKEQRIFGDGDVIFIHSGENIVVQRGWNATATVGTIAGIFSATYDRRKKVEGNFWEIIPQTDMVNPYEIGNESNGDTIGVDDSGLPYYMSKDGPQDLTKIKEIKTGGGGGGGCNQAGCSTVNSKATAFTFFSILMLWLLMGVRRSRRRALSLIRENNRKSR